MSHEHVRSEKVCLNCGAQPLHDRYCHHCGQENVEPRQTLWHLVVHFFNDVTHFDGKFFSTLKYLLFKPGFLSDEYVRGRRIKYLDPIRMYLFISAVFLFVFLAVVHPPHRVSLKKDREIIHATDSMRIAEMEDNSNGMFEDYAGKSVFILNVPYAYRHGEKYYDSVQQSLPEKERDGWFAHYMAKRQIGMYEVYDEEPYNFLPAVIERFLHSFAKIFFIALPFFAFFLWLLYIRSRKKYYYVAHAIFSLHYFSVGLMFTLLLLPFIYLDLRYNSSDYPLYPFMVLALYIGMIIYLYIAMKRFYAQGWFKTLIKHIILSVATSALVLFIFTVMFLNSFLSAGH